MKIKKVKPEIIKIRFCPNCKSTNVDMVAGGGFGFWRCLNCSFQGPIFPEKEINLEDLKKKEKNAKAKKEK